MPRNSPPSRNADMKSLIIFLFILTCSLNTHSAVVWDWEFAGSERGRILTSGNYTKTKNSNNFTFFGFRVDNSAVDGNAGADYGENQPTQGFLWDGSVPSVFYRSSGLHTNGSNFFHAITNISYGLQPPPTSSSLSFPARGVSINGVIILQPTPPLFEDKFETTP